MHANDWPKPELRATHWQERGACHHHPELSWFPGQGEPQAEQREICATCPVQTECLAYALSQSETEDFGIWGGTSAKQRTAIRRRKAIASGSARHPAECGTRSGYMRHRRRHEPICDECRTAHNAYNAELRIRNLPR